MKIILLAGFMLIVSCNQPEQKEYPIPGKFEIIVLPDLQYMTQKYPEILNSMFDWIVDNYKSENIKAVIQVGDLTQSGSESEYNRIDKNFKKLDAIGVPYITVPGNHDYAEANPSSRDLELYNKYFNAERFKGKLWYCGNYGPGNENSFIKFDAAGHRYLIMGLEFSPRDTVLSWAGRVLDSVHKTDTDFPSRKFFIVTHGYLTAFGERSTDTSDAGPGTYGLSADNSGQEIWEKLVSKNQKNYWVISGHHRTSNTSRSPHIVYKKSTGESGYYVDQLMVNYQQDTNGGNGYFMRMAFTLDSGIVCTFYSSHLKKKDNRFPPISLQFPQ